jgi:hypothetical protein
MSVGRCPTGKGTVNSIQGLTCELEGARRVRQGIKGLTPEAIAITLENMIVAGIQDGTIAIPILAGLLNLEPVRAEAIIELFERG